MKKNFFHIASSWAKIFVFIKKIIFRLFIFLKVGVKYSAEMEVFALKSLLNFLGDCGLKIGVLVTDRSTTVRAMLSAEFPAINHQFDIWFVVN